LVGKDFPAFGIASGTIPYDFDFLYVRNGFLYMGAKPVDGSRTSDVNQP
jgi:hypothetical protein